MIFYAIKKGVLNNFAKFTAKFMWTSVLVLVRTDLVQPAANFLMFCRIDCKSVSKVLGFSTEMQFSTDQHIKNDDAHKW